MSDWRPSATIETLRQRAAALAGIRHFFACRQVMEVDVPVLAEAAVTDPNIESLVVSSPLSESERFFLMTSPEFYMKRLLAAGSGPIYYLGRAFRAGDRGTRHRPEFTMLEWYRPEWTLVELMDEVALLVSQYLPGEVSHTTYRQAFVTHAGIDPFAASLTELQAVAMARLSPAFDSDERTVWLDLLFSHLVEPQLRGQVFVTGFPAGQAALAQTQVDEQGDRVAARFELYIDGLEIANGYQEELDADVLAQRFAEDLSLRAARGQNRPPVDQCFLAAMRSGIPACAGVAMGVDRLLMCIANTGNIAAVIPFAD